MPQDQFNNLMLIAIYKVRFGSFNLVTIANKLKDGSAERKSVAVSFKSPDQAMCIYIRK